MEVSRSNQKPLNGEKFFEATATRLSTYFSLASK